MYNIDLLSNPRKASKHIYIYVFEFLRMHVMPYTQVALGI